MSLSCSLASHRTLTNVPKLTTAVSIVELPPIVFDVASHGGQTSLKWVGGSGRFQVESTDNLLLGAWVPAGPIVESREWTGPDAAPRRFYRVVSLVNN